MYKPEPGFEKESFKPVRNINQVRSLFKISSSVLALMS